MSKAIIDKNLLDQPVVKYIVKDYLILDSNSNVVDAARLMKEKRHECIIIVEDKKPMGMLTLKDIVYKVVAEGKDPRKTRLKELISRPLISVDPETKVGDAIKLMVEEDIRRLPVIKSDMVLGVFVLRAIVGDVVEKSITLPDIEVHEGLKCPYCGSVFQTREELSKHIDRVHIGAGLLEGVALRRE
ncbi:MAG: CBS domain-containing protein [Aigarchaeota archaeon]|nr:CBS domain-containing protein [Aigarchaeota archaeon]MDW7986358.1 CBS domain-containing protein [Nitrososphaerota archaeon]